MTKLYLANWATPEDLDCVRDDLPFDCVADLAEPNGVVLRHRDPHSIQLLLDGAKEECSTAYGLEQAELAEIFGSALWHTDGWQPGKTTPGRQEWMLFNGDDLLLWVSLREATVIGED